MNSSECVIPDLKTVLVATDESAHSKIALDRALGVAKACSAKMYAVSVVEATDELEALAPDLIEKRGNTAKKLLASIEERAKKEGVDCEGVIHIGDDPSSFIVEEAKKHHVDLIVMGKHGTRKSITQLIMGSVTARVLSHAPCNVLVIIK